MTSIIWVGEGDEPSHIVWNGIVFPRGQAVPVDNPWMIAKARSNAYFTVSDTDRSADANRQAPVPPVETLPEMPPAPPLTEQVAAVKRKRGRPRKYPLEVPDADH